MAHRVDSEGRAYKRSQLQIQIAVNRYRADLEEKLLSALPTLAHLEPELHWCSPREDDHFREYWDGKLVERIGRPELRPDLRAFWPARGPHWDAVAVARTNGGDWLGPVLVEAKSYPGEVRSRCATEGERRELIEQRLADTRSWLKVPHKHAEWWVNGLYQAANRLSFLRFFRQILHEDAWLANVYIVNDPHAPTSRAGWDRAIKEAFVRLGIDENGIPDAGTVFVAGRDRAELVGL